MEKSLIELAYEYVSSQPGLVSFANIWQHVKEASGLSEEAASKKAGQFFTNMMLDGRFVTLGENNWDLRSRQTFDKVHIDMKDVYSDVETSYVDNEEGTEDVLGDEMSEGESGTQSEEGEDSSDDLDTTF